MILQEVLQLDKQQSSIKKIDLFLVGQIKLSDDYMKALAYKADILHAINKTNEALRLLFSYIPSLNAMKVDGVIALCDSIINIFIDTEKYEEAYKYINIKKNFLPISKFVLNVKDEIKLFLAKKEITLAKNALNKFLTEDITREEEMYAKEELASIYYNERQYDKFIELARDLEAYYQANMALPKLTDLTIKRLKMAFYSGNYNRVILDGNNIIREENLNNKQILSIATLLIKSYLASNDYKRASIIESDYEEYINDEYIDESLEFCKSALELYTKTNTIVSINEYQNKIKDFTNKKQPLTKPKSNKKEEIIIPFVDTKIENKILEDINDGISYSTGFLNPIIEEPKTLFKQDISKEYKEYKKIELSKNYEALSKIFNSINDIDLNVKFRELYRNCCINICKNFDIDEIYLLYYKRGYLGLHYKKERAYDKRLKFEDIENTINLASMESEAELFLDPQNPEFNKNIVTNLPYEEIPYGFSYPIADKGHSIGSITFTSKQSFIDQEMVYESLLLIIQMLNTRLLTSLKQDELEYNNRKTFFINQHMSSGIKEEMEGYLHFSTQACEMLGVLENIGIDDFLINMKSTYVGEYKRLREEIYTLMSENIVYEYEYKKNDKWIKVRERFYPTLMDGVICILSLIDDITKDFNDKNDLIALAYTNPISKLDTEVKLIVDLEKQYMYKRLALCVFEIIDFSLYKELYGFNFANQLIFTVGKELKQAFENDFNFDVYHLEADRYAILMNGINDKRVVDSKLIAAFNKISNNLYSLNSRVKLLFNCGVYRLGRNVNLDEPSKILLFAIDALTDAVDMDNIGHHIAHFDGEAQKKRFAQNSLITHISESIDHGKLGLTYHQIVDLVNTQVYGYHIMLNLDNFDVDYKYMDEVIKRRGLTRQIEKYAIGNTFKELKMLNDSVKGYVMCFVNVSKPTLDEEFYSFINQQQSFFKVPAQYIVLKTDNASHPVLQRLRQKEYLVATDNLMDVYRNACDYFIYDYHSVGKESILEILELCDNHNVICILGGMNTKEDIEMAREDGYALIYGSFYKKSLRMKSIIEKLKN
ncbi:MAG: EAL domain-containing protein [Acholeplasmatales bacterium]|nr:EAL domain-containing protein [Acholeplasmatales bacterium]